MSETSRLTVILDTQGNKQTVEVSSAECLLQALTRQKLYIKSSCGGVASCSDCIIKVLSGADNLSPPGFDETTLLGNVFHLTGERLSCQTRALGSATIDIGHHDKERDQEQIKKRTTRTPPPSRKRNKVRKQKEVEAIKKERLEQKKEQNRSWERHWEKDPAENPPRKQGGYRRPRPFRTDHLDEDGEK